MFSARIKIESGVVLLCAGISGHCQLHRQDRICSSNSCCTVERLVGAGTELEELDARGQMQASLRAWVEREAPAAEGSPPPERG